MEIARERLLDESKQYHVTLSLRSRTTEMHTVLTALTREERDALGMALAHALDEIQRILTARLSVERARLERPAPLTG